MTRGDAGRGERGPKLSDVELDRHLAGGRPGGPELDEVWGRVQTSLRSASSTEAAPFWRRWGARLGVPLAGLAAGAALVLAFVGPALHQESGALVARGGGEGGAPVLEATCGHRTAPCHVEQPVFLRVHGGAVEHRVTVVLLTRSSPWVLLDQHRVMPGETLAVPRKILPEQVDVEDGVIIEMTAQRVRAAPVARSTGISGHDQAVGSERAGGAVVGDREGSDGHHNDVDHNEGRDAIVQRLVLTVAP